MADTTEHGWLILDAARGIWCFDYSFGPGRANSFAVRFGDGQVAVFSPACKVAEGAYADLSQLGTVSAVVATNGFHHLGLAEWRNRFPQARFFAPADAHPRIKKQSPEAGELEPLSALQALLGTSVLVREARNTKCGELYVIVKDGSAGPVWFASDILANIPSIPGNPLIRLLFKLSKSGPGYRIFHLALFPLVKDKRGLLRAMLSDLDALPPAMVVPAHGIPLSQPTLPQDTRALLEAAV